MLLTTLVLVFHRRLIVFNFLFPLDCHKVVDLVRCSVFIVQSGLAPPALVGLRRSVLSRILHTSRSFARGLMMYRRWLCTHSLQETHEVCSTDEIPLPRTELRPNRSWGPAVVYL